MSATRLAAAFSAGTLLVSIGGLAVAFKALQATKSESRKGWHREKLPEMAREFQRITQAAYMIAHSNKDLQPSRSELTPLLQEAMNVQRKFDVYGNPPLREVADTVVGRMFMVAIALEPGLTKDKRDSLAQDLRDSQIAFDKAYDKLVL